MAKASLKELSKRRTHSPEFKAKDAVDAFSSRKTLLGIDTDHDVHSIQVSQCKKQMLEVTSELFTGGKKTKDKEESQAKEAELFEQIGKLQISCQTASRSYS